MRTAFSPEVHGFHFANSFVNILYLLPPPFSVNIPVGAGRCGGMAFAALDYFFAGVPVPTHVAGDFGAAGVPPDSHPLAHYISDRFVDSLAANALTFAAWTQASDQSGFPRGAGVPEMTRSDQVPALINALSSGPVPLGLVKAGPDDFLLTAIGHNHQVVAYGWDRGPDNVFKAYLYDNNYPDQEVVLSLDLNDPQAYAQTSPGDRWRGFFVETYGNPTAPRYVDLAVDDSLAVSDRAPLVGTALGAHFRVKNTGASPAHLAQLAFQITGPAGEDLSMILPGDGNPAPLLPGDQRTIFKATASFGASPGLYTVAAAYVSANNHLLRLPPAAWNAATSAAVNVHPAIRSMIVTADRLAPRLNRRTTFTVGARDEQLGSAVPGARVWITPAGGGPEVDLGDANTPLTYVFRRAKSSDTPGAWVYPHACVRAVGYEDAPVDLGFPGN